MKMQAKGVSETIAYLRKRFSEESAAIKNDVTEELVVALKAQTPVDTGAARDAWIVDDKGDITNKMPYIGELNSGSSIQAPAHFIEATVLKHKAVRPNGQICSYNPSSIR